MRFDDVCCQLAKIDRLHLEPDGSFVWVGDGWQLDGMLYDRDEYLQYVDLKGSCPAEIWRMLISVLGGSALPMGVVSPATGDLYDLQTFANSVWPAAIGDGEYEE